MLLEGLQNIAQKYWPYNLTEKHHDIIICIGPIFPTHIYLATL